MTGVCVGLSPRTSRTSRPSSPSTAGPMESIPRFIACKQNPEKITYKHPSLRPILQVTYGCIVYQEQVIRIFQDWRATPWDRPTWCAGPCPKRR